MTRKARVERGIQLGLLVVLALLLYGWSLAPSVAPFAPASVLVASGAVALHRERTIGERDRRIFHAVLACGALAAVVFVPSILIE